MKITKRDLGVLMILVGLLVAFLTYQMSFTKTMDEVEKLQEEQKTLTQKIKEIEPVKQKKAFYESEMARYAEEIKKIVAEYPVNIIYEDGIMYVVDMREEVGTKVSVLTVNPAAVVSSVTDGDGKEYKLLKATESMTYESSDYAELKDLLNYIYKESEFKNIITAVSMSFNNKEGSVTGALNISLYAMDDGSRVYEPVEIPEEVFAEDNIGVDSIFGETEEAEEEE